MWVFLLKYFVNLLWLLLCLHACLAAWLPGCLAAWLPGCLATRMPGCLTACAFVPAHQPASQREKNKHGRTQQMASIPKIPLIYCYNYPSSLSLSIYLSLPPLSVSLSACPLTYLSACLLAHLPCLPACLTTCLSVYLIEIVEYTFRDGQVEIKYWCVIGT